MPLEMAQCAREKLQASAREIWSSIRSFDDGTKKKEGDSPMSAESAAVMSLERIESVFKVMFGSCTSGSVPHASPEAEPAPPSKPAETRSRSARSREILSGEHVYAQLFMDDQARASRAVDGLRERAASSPRSRSGSRFRESFPKVSPSGLNAGPVTPPTATAVDISQDLSFDDGISAISAHTLEEMARVHDHKASFYNKSSFASNRPSQVEKISYPGSNRRDSGASVEITRPIPAQATSSPVKFTRGRSNGTTGSKGTKSTKSSQDSEFVSVWKKEERKYWDDVVQQDKKVDKKNYGMTGTPKHSLAKKGRRRSRCGSLSTKQDITITTASSSSYSNFSSNFDKYPHPHDVIQFDTSDLLGSPDIYHRDLPITSLDPSRIQKCMVVPYGSELGEI